jgi:RNA exonuclease NGL2
MIHREILTRDADIFCLQEVDRTETLFPLLKRVGYRHHYSIGPGKKHGCLIGFKDNRFECVGTEQVLYDEQYVHSIEKGDDTSETKAKGISFKTTNIGALVKLKDIKHPVRGFIVATTHLFWHPKYTYERSRQLGILLREALKFRATTAFEKTSLSGATSWPILLAGDLNFAPSDAAYSLLLQDTVMPFQEASLQFSRVVHRSIDPSVPDNRPKQGSSKDEDEGGDGEEGQDQEEQDPDRVIFSARQALPDDALLSTPQLVDLYSAARGLSVQSAYNDGLRAVRQLGKQKVRVFGDRVDVGEGRQGGYEPEWTSYTHHWKTVLDYILLIDAPQSRVLSLLEPLATEQMEPGLPQTGVCGSDHVSLCVDVGWRI